ncbi:MAG: hypothetical protein FVQ79_10430 [Planctomycetes bacterium]|nr:hypothetical protein [Planctomycetota bacterium]
MKDSTKYAKKLTVLLKTLKKEHSEINIPTYSDPVESVIFAVLAEHLKSSTVRTTVRKMQKHFVDYNDVRVARTEEMLDVLGGETSELRGVAHTLSKLLNSVFTKFNTVSLMALTEMGKRPGRKELENMEGITPFIVSYCFLTSLKGHAIPVNKKMVEYLRGLELVHPRANPHGIEGFLERQISASNAYEYYTLIRDAAEKFVKPASKKKVSKKKAVKKTKSKKTVKKARAKKPKAASKKKAVEKTKAKKAVKKKKSAKK